MATEDEFAHITNKKLLGFVDFDAYLLKYLRRSIHAAISRLFVQGSFGEKLPLFSPGAGVVQVGHKSTAEDALAHDGKGHLLDFARTERAAVFENLNGITYEVGAEYIEFPRGIRINPRTGKPEYDRLVEGIGVQATPNSIDVGSDTITFVVDSLFEQGTAVANHTGRQVRVFRTVLGDVATTESAAIEIATVFYDDGQNKITTVGLLGQTEPAFAVSGYVVQLIGLTVLKDTADNRPSARANDVFFVGTVEGNGGEPTVFDVSEQQVIMAQGAVGIVVGELPQWADETPNPGDDLQAVLEKMISDLTSSTGNERGAGKLTAPRLRDERTLYEVPAQRLDQSLVSVMGFLAQTAFAVNLEAVRRTKSAIFRSSHVPILVREGACGMAVSPSGEMVVISRDGVSYGANILHGPFEWSEGTGWSHWEPGDGALGGVIWDGAQFVAFGNTRIQTSSDGGANWVERVGGGPMIWSIAVNLYTGSPIRVAIADFGFYRSTDGLVWTWVDASAAFTGANTKNHVVFDRAHYGYVAILSNGTTLFSYDGLTWEARTSHDLRQITNAFFYPKLGAVVVSGMTVDGFWRVLCSVDGCATWNIWVQHFGGESMRIVAYSADSCVLLYHNGDLPGWGGPVLRVAADPKRDSDWTYVTVPSPLSMNDGDWTSYVYGNMVQYCSTFLAGMSAIVFFSGSELYRSELMGHADQWSLPPSLG